MFNMMGNFMKSYGDEIAPYKATGVLSSALLIEIRMHSDSQQANENAFLVGNTLQNLLERGFEKALTLQARFFFCVRSYIFRVCTCYQFSEGDRAVRRN